VGSQLVCSEEKRFVGVAVGAGVAAEGRYATVGACWHSLV